MSAEAWKTLQLWEPAQKAELLRGKGIDIGCGSTPVTPDCRRFDVSDGDANHILNTVNDTFDFVFSSHCLEHMFEPAACLKDWWSLVAPGGRMIVLVPDEDLYEQGVFPSRFNPDHKWTFTISKTKSWSAKSVNLLPLVQTLPDLQSFRIEQQDIGYDRAAMRFKPDCFFARLIRSFRFRILDRLPVSERWKNRFCALFYAPDQTQGSAVAQIQLTAWKKS